MTVAEKKVVSLIYELRKENAEGDIVESLTKHNPLTFIFGIGNLLPKFEANIKGLKEGDKFNFNLKSEDAYGPVEESAIIDVPIKAFEVDGKIDHNLLKIGNSIAMLTRENRKINGTVMEIGEEKVKMNFNHPMAGMDLYFSGEITKIREASENEIRHGHVHSSDHDCGDGGGCSGCSGGCC